MSDLYPLSALVLVINAFWHGMAGYYFTFRPAVTLERHSTARPPGAIAIELMRFLGALNLAITGLALLALLRPMGSRSVVVGFLFLANLSQFVVDLRVRRLGLTTPHFDRTILAGDGLMAGLNLAAFIILFLSRV